MIHKMKVFLSLLMSSLFMIGRASAQTAENLSFSDWDKNGDKLISRSEFVDVFTREYYDDWNTTDDEYLDDEDFYTRVYSLWDADEDALLTEEEWTAGYELHYKDYTDDDFIAIDTDGDGYIDYNEFFEVMGDTDYYISWDVDADAYLNQWELARFVFNNWDTNNSNFIDPEEYAYFDIYFEDI